MVARTLPAPSAPMNVNGATIRSLSPTAHADRVAETIRSMVESAIENYWICTGQLAELRERIDSSDDPNEVNEAMIRIGEEAAEEATRRIINSLLVLVGDPAVRPVGITHEDEAYLLQATPDGISLLVVSIDAIAPEVI